MELEARLVQVIEEKDSQTQEHEDLLVMLTEQGEKLAKYKVLYINHNLPVQICGERIFCTSICIQKW